MPETEVVIFAEAGGSAPLVDWLDGLPPKVQDKCLERIERLGAFGHELRRPLADSLRAKIHELRVRHGQVNYRMLYFFNGQRAVVTHGLIKEDVVPDSEIDLAVARKVRFEQDPDKHTYRE